MQKYQYPPGPKGKIGWNHLIAMFLHPLSFMEGLAVYGDIVHFEIWPRHFYLLNHPDYIKEALVTQGNSFVKAESTRWLKPLLGEGLLTSEGDFHLKQRRMIQPSFHRQRIAAYASIMSEYARQTRDSWQEGIALDVSQEMARLTLRIVAETLFSARIEDEARIIREALDATGEWFRNFSLPLGNLINKLPLPVVQDFKQGRARLDEIIYRIIRERRESKEDRGDLLSMLLMARDDAGEQGGMSDRQVRDEALTLLLAGHETTANALTWTWYLLSQHPEIEAKLVAELEEQLQGRPPGMEDLPRLRYTEMVFTEALRLFPPVWGMAREAAREVEIGGYYIPKGATVFAIQTNIHRDPRFYPEPERFIPERWNPDLKMSRPKYAYFPFGGGNRLCIGESFAWMEGVLVLATIAQKWRLGLEPKHRVEGRAIATLRAKYGMRMIPERRVFGGRPFETAGISKAA